MATPEVHSYHINVGIGDAAIHLLVDHHQPPEQQPLTAPNTKPTVLRAILIDTGKPLKPPNGGPGNTQAVNIAKTVAKIEQFYNFVDRNGLPDTNLRFDSVVTTHMDGDHYSGILEILQAEFTTPVNTQTTTTTIDDARANYYNIWRSAACKVIQRKWKKISYNGSLLLTKPRTSEAQSMLGTPGDPTFMNQAKVDLRLAVSSLILERDRARQLLVANAAKKNKKGKAAKPVTVKDDSNSRRKTFNNMLSKAAYQISPTTVQPQLQSKYFKYNRNTPLTAFYFPYVAMTSKDGLTQRICPHGWDKRWWFDANANSCYVGNGNDTLNFCFSLPVDVTAIPLPDINNKPDDYPMYFYIQWRVNLLASVVANANQYLGAELFFPEVQPVAPTQAGITNPGKLISTAKLTMANGPRMYIVAGDQVIIGNTPLAAATTGSVPDPHRYQGDFVLRPRQDIIDSSHAGLGVRTAIQQKMESHPKNAKSICTLILASTADNWTSPPDDDELLSHVRLLSYNAGDALWDVETALAEWIQPTGEVIQPAAVMKLSHHGASESTTQLLLENLRPQTIVISNPAGRSFFHPSPEVLFYLHAFSNAERALTLDVAPVPRPLLCTNYPVWFTNAPAKIMSFRNMIPTEMLLPGTSAVLKAFVEALDELNEISQIDQDLSPWGLWNMADVFDKDVTDPPIDVGTKEDAEKLKLLEVVRRAIISSWDALSPQPATMAITAWIMVLSVQSSVTDHRVLTDGLKFKRAYPKNELTQWLPPKPLLPLLPAPSTGQTTPQNLSGAKRSASQMALTNSTPVQAAAKVQKFGQSQIVVNPVQGPVQQAMDANDGSNLSAIDMEADDFGLPTAPVGGTQTTQNLMVRFQPRKTFTGLRSAQLARRANGQSLAFRNMLDAVTSMFSLNGTTVNRTNTITASQAWLCPPDGSTNPLNDFVNSLSSAALVLNGVLSSSPSTLILSNQYDWGYWLATGTDVTSVTLTAVQGATQLVQVSQIDADVAILGGLTFSSQSSLTSTIPAAAAQTPAINDSFLPDVNYLILGLSQTTRQTVGIGTILNTFAPSWLGQTQGYLPGFGNALSFTLDGSKAGSRNAIFCQPDAGYATHVRLEFEADQNTLGGLHNALSFLGSAFTVNNMSLIIRKSTARYGKAASTLIKTDFEVSARTNVTVTYNGADGSSKQSTFDVWFVFDADNIEIVVDFQTAPPGFGDLMAWLFSVIEYDSFDVSSLLPAHNVADLQLHQFKFNVSCPDSSLLGAFNPNNWSVSAVFEVVLFNMLFLVNLNWALSGSMSLDAKLWQYVPLPASEFKYPLFPVFETYKYTFPFNLGAASGTTSVASLLTSDAPNLPLGIHPDLVGLEFSATLQNGQVSLDFQGDIAVSFPSGQDVPALELCDLQLSASYKGAVSAPTSTSGGVQPGSYDVLLASTVYLIPRNFDPNSATSCAEQFMLRLEVTDGTWIVSAEALDVQFAALYNLFDEDANDTVMDLLEHFSIPEFSIMYNFGNGSNLLLISGILQVGALQLDLSYSNWSADDGHDWIVSAHLYVTTGTDENGAPITLQKIISAFDPQSEIAPILDDIPFIRDVALPAVSVDVDADDQDSDPDAPISLFVSKTDAGILLWFRVEIDTDAGALSFLFVQIKPVPDPNDKTKTNPKAKRLIRVQLDHLPQFPNIPIVGQIEQPVDALLYMFVQDIDGGNSASGVAGLTQDEIDTINATLSDADAVQYRQTQPPATSTPSATTTTPNYPLHAGHHFMAVVEGKVVIDHIFGGQDELAKTTPASPPSGKSSSGSGSSGAVVRTVSTTPTATQSDTGTTMGVSTKKYDIISLANIGIHVKNDHLFVVLDATITLGPIQFTLMGFGIGLPLKVGSTGKSVTFNNLSQLSISDFDIELSGLSVYANIPPILLAGFFEHVVDANSESYLGGLAIGIQAYVLLAVGEYTHTFTPDFKSVFLFGRLDGPLVTLEFAEISGVEVGFGYNYDLTLPAPNQVVNYPMIHSTSSSNNPMDLLKVSDPPDPTTFNYWQTAAQQQYWFALGMKIDSFQIITADAAIVFAFGANELKIGLVGMASATLPPMRGQKPPEAFVYAELAIVASLDVFGGSLVIGAELTPSSYIFAPDCHLTGGFALCYWFGASPYAGDWVFSVGGYHPAFKPPSYYPVPSPVGISWQLSDVLSITGTAFFTICPSACMGGGKLDAVFNCGPIYAEFIAWAMFLMNFKPFFLVADIGLSVEVGFHCDIGLIHINIHAEVDAELHIQGPPIGGYAEVNLWIHKFKIKFGPQNEIPAPLSWDQFLAVVQKPGPGANDSPALVVIAIVDGTANEKTTSVAAATGDNWFVRAPSFVFRVECKVPINTLTYGDGIIQDSTPSSLNPNPIYARLMQSASALQSVLTVSVKYLDYGTITPTPDTDTASSWNITPTYKNLPEALWKKYDVNNDPIASGNSIESILSSSDVPAIPQLVGFHFKIPDPSLPKFNIPEFNAASAMAEDIFKDTDNPHLPTTAAKQTTNLADQRQTDPWAAVTTAWTATAAKPGIGKVLVNAYTSLLGWNIATVLTASTSPPPSPTLAASTPTVPTAITTPTAATIPPSSQSRAPSASTLPATITAPTTSTIPPSSSTLAPSAPTAPAANSVVGSTTTAKAGLVYSVPKQLLSKFDQYYLSAPYLSAAA